MAPVENRPEVRKEAVQLGFSRPEAGTLLVHMEGTWKLGKHLPGEEAVWKAVDSDGQVKRMAFDTSRVHSWDSGLLNFLLKLFEGGASRKIKMDPGGLSEGIRRLLKLATAIPERKGAKREASRDPFLVRIGSKTLGLFESSSELLGFLGEAFVVFFQFLRGKAQFQRSEFLLILQACGAQALPIVSLISVLVGLILAFVGAVQLMMFGAQIYVANLVAIAMTREMGAMMTGIIMAGRTGAAFAAQLGTMQVNEEIDALKTLGISPMAFLVLPRMLALILMMPLLCIYSDLMGILGGYVVGIGMLDLTSTQYFQQTTASITVMYFAFGVFKSAVFGVVVAFAGCIQGMNCGRSASAVGNAATSAVVSSIVAIIVLDGMFAVITSVLRI
jgi:phospholipid/cholesterol/gamma-HCH transport system permease protein